MPSRCPGVAELPALARIEGGNGSAGHFYHENSKGTGEHHKADKITEGHRVYSHFAKLQELWKITQVQTIHIPKSMTDAPFLKHPELTSGQKRYLYSIAKICDSGYLRTLMKRQYMHVLHQGSQKPGTLTHHRSHISSRYSQKQHSPCTTWRHHLEREESLSVSAATPEMIIHSLWRPLRHKEGLKIGYASKTRCKSLKTFRRQGRLLLLPVSLDDSQPCMNEETKEEELLNECMQSMSIQEPRTSQVNMTVSIPTSVIS
ncbi:protein FAM216A [Phodopus roborovskii]|uniref:Fam216a protein n=1 Tax=Phodopus roborovskii TaxID=109678 RepID=A0AAU9YYN1_PHORO|nr:protein FAM216A [Phodopus roborovskii]CAH6778882.1 Fam216a [Phodopus roborovskii]